MMITVIMIITLIMSAVVHEVAHGLMAYHLGDDTARNENRLTLNPFNHLDLFGSIILPILLVLTKANFFIAWAKPVPINPNHLRDRKYGMLKVALAGPASNLVLASFFALVARLLPLAAVDKLAILNAYFSYDVTALLSLIGGSIFASLYVLSAAMCLINFALMLFNLIPWPPLDGSKIIFPFLPAKIREFFLKMEYGFGGLLLLMAFVYLGAFDFVGTLTIRLFALFMGIPV